MPEFIFDFGSPNAYLAHRVLPAIEAHTGARFAYTPVLLGGIFKATNNQSPVMAFAHVPSKLAYERIEMQRFIARHGLTKFQMNPHFPVNTLLLMRIAVAADEDGALARFAEAAFAAMWEKGLKMDDPAVVTAELQAVGLDGERLLARAQEAAVKAKLIENTERAIACGVFGVPTFFVSEEMYFGKDRLRDVEEAIEAGKR